MIRIDEMTRGRFGNEIFQYNVLVQIANTLSVDASCVPWEGNTIFEGIEGYKESTNNERMLDWREILNEGVPSNNNIDYAIGEYCIHNTFWEVTKTDPRKFFQINNTYKKNFSEDEIHVGIHFRGTDILGADGNNGREIHPPQYYMDAIDCVENEFDGNIHYHICTDDINFVSFLKTVSYLDAGQMKFSLGSPDHFHDFATLTECDVIIASSSTFAVCAGFIGKKDKKIIHSAEWIDKNLNHTPWHVTPDPNSVREWQLSFDKFWTRLHEGGNDFYRAWKFI